MALLFWIEFTVILMILTFWEDEDEDEVFSIELDTEFYELPMGVPIPYEIEEIEDEV